MSRLKVYEADVFDYTTKSRRYVFVAAPNRKEAVQWFNGRESNGRGYTARIRIMDEPNHPAMLAGEGVVMVEVGDGWQPLREGLFSHEQCMALIDIELCLAGLGFKRISPNVYAKLPERRWWRADGTLVVLYSPMHGLPARLSVSGDGLWIGCPWGEWDKLPATIARIENHRKEIVG